MKTSILAVLLSAVPTIAADIYTFGLIPVDGSIAGIPGSTIGWGYSIENQSSSLWLVTSGLDSGVFQHGTPSSIFDFPDIAPAQTVTVPFNSTISAGLYQLIWDATAPAGFVNSGRFVLDAEWWDGAPQNGGGFVSSAPTATQFYTAAVTGVPEPGTISIVAVSMLLLLGVGTMRRRSELRRSPTS
jgi:hypothetical protein